MLLELRPENGRADPDGSEARHRKAHRQPGGEDRSATEIIQAYENADAWRTAVRTGQTTIEQMQAAFDLEEQGEVSAPLPSGYFRHEGKVVRLDPGGEATGTETPPSEDDGFDVNASFLGSVS